ncbi:hypothetical protein [Massilia consociata]|uniref:Uncharacterized protein n=1 Tax=Massilia consociata TaxID=760117 RepID=A0ABV6FCG9_9BURK
MLSEADCRLRAKQCLTRIAQQCGEDLVLMPSPFGMATTLAYTYQTKAYVATGDFIHALAGNGPILVNKLTGAVEVAAAVFSTEDSIRAFENRAGKPT